MSQYDVRLRQHYTLDTDSSLKKLVRDAAQTQSLTLNTNTTYFGGMGDSNLDFNDNKEIKSTLGHGKLMGYDSAGKLLMRFRVALKVQNGYVGRDADVTLTPHTLQGFGRMSSMDDTGGFSVPPLDTAIGDASGEGGFVLSAPKVTIKLEVVPEPAGVTDTGEIIYHATLIGTGELSEVYLVLDEDATQQRLDKLPTEEAFMTATPPQVKALDPTLDVSWLQLPVGTLGDDVVQLSKTSLINESRLVVQDTITLILPVMNPESETELMDAVKAIASERGYSLIDHVA